MPKIRGLTESQRQAKAVDDFCENLMDLLNMERGRLRKSGNAFAKDIGISGATWCRWNAGKLKKTELGAVLIALQKVGMSLEIKK